MQKPYEPNPPRESGSPARRVAFETLWRVERNKSYADRIFDQLLKKRSDLKKVDRALAQEIIFGTLRRQGTLDDIIADVARRPVGKIDMMLLVVLRIGAYQLLFLSKIPQSAAVNEAVVMAKSLGKSHAAGFVNGVLRQIARNKDRLIKVDPKNRSNRGLVKRLSHPLWLIRKWTEQFGEAEARELCLADNTIPPLTIRTNTLKGDTDRLREILLGESVQSEPATFAPDGLRITGLPVPISGLDCFRKGEFHVQDEASQLMEHWLDVSPSHRVLDACAAPGGKTATLAQLMGNRGDILAADSNLKRLESVKTLCRRLGIENVRFSCEDMRHPPRELKGAFDRILLDAPCSGLGVLRRNPETKWRRTFSDVKRMSVLQAELLNGVWPLLKPGGILLYSVCTLTREENRGVLDPFLESLPDVRLLSSHGALPESARKLIDENGLFASFSHRHGIDGFFGFRLEKSGV